MATVIETKTVTEKRPVMTRICDGCGVVVPDETNAFVVYTPTKHRIASERSSLTWRLDFCTEACLLRAMQRFSETVAGKTDTTSTP